MSEVDELVGWHTVSVRPYIGEGSNGPRYGAAADLVCTVTEQTDVTVTSTGNTVGTRTTIVFQPADKALIPSSSLVTLPAGDEREVTSVSITDAPAPFDGLNLGIADVT